VPTVGCSLPSQFPPVTTRSGASLQATAKPISPEGRNYLTCLRRELLLYHASQIHVAHSSPFNHRSDVALPSSHYCDVALPQWGSHSFVHPIPATICLFVVTCWLFGSHFLFVEFPFYFSFLVKNGLSQHTIFQVLPLHV